MSMRTSNLISYRALQDYQHVALYENREKWYSDVGRTKTGRNGPEYFPWGWVARPARLGDSRRKARDQAQTAWFFVSVKPQ